MEFSRNEKVDQEELFKHRTNKSKGDSAGQTNNRQELIQKGHDLQEEGMQGLHRVRKNMYQLQEMADTITV